MKITAFINRQFVFKTVLSKKSDAWKLYKDRGCSLRLSWPQRQSEGVWKLVSLVEEYFGCGGGANVYATPPGKQGFAPHWDDIDAFILQLEGCKHWRVYAPRTQAEVLPRFSSANLNPDELGPLIGEATLRPRRCVRRLAWPPVLPRDQTGIARSSPPGIAGCRQGRRLTLSVLSLPPPMPKGAVRENA